MNMTLDEAIEHCEEVAKENRELFEKIGTSSYDEDGDNCLECAKAHEQLAEWLKELKCQRKAWEKVKAEIEVERDDCQIYKLQYAFWDGEDYAYKECLKIIDKHLQEVTTDADSD